MKRFLTLILILISSLILFAAFCSCNLQEQPDNSDSTTSNTISKPNDESKSDNSFADTDDSNDTGECVANGHTDADRNDYCDKCDAYLIVLIDFYSVNDLHGKFCDTESQPGVDELGTFFENKKQTDDHVVLLSTGDMWQGSAESVLSNGKIIIDWMNELGFEAMTLGNHEFDWGEQVIKDNALVADFPFLAINIYDNNTGALAEYCRPSVVFDRGDIQIAIIGAIGDCYSSISSDMVTDVHFKTGSELTNLVKSEAQQLRNSGVDIIVYSIHDGLGSTMDSFNHYDDSLSCGYVDVVFEGHSHQAYIKNDSMGVVHIQGGGENYGLTHIEISVNSVTGSKNITAKEIVTNNSYKNLDDHEPTEAIENQYSDIIDYAYSTLGTVSKKYFENELTDYVANLYLDAGEEKWGNKYNIALGGGFLQTRAPYDLSPGQVNYADILSLFPFNNRIVLCSVSGNKLSSQFINTTNQSYHIALNDGFDSTQVQAGRTYYVVVDMYTALYRYNGLTIIDYYDQETYARDLLAKAIKNGELNSDSIINPEEPYSISPIDVALQIGMELQVGEETSEYLYFQGTISNFTNSKYGNCYLTDKSGTQIYVYGLNDIYGNRYDSMNKPPLPGDEIVIRSTIKKYAYNSGETIIELTNSVVIDILP